MDPPPSNCDAFTHPPYGSNQQYRAERGNNYVVGITLAQLAMGAQKCGFCSILYQGIHLKKYQWIAEWARYQWIISHPDSNIMEYE